jgi:hypothetical protein
MSAYHLSVLMAFSMVFYADGVLAVFGHKLM